MNAIEISRHARALLRSFGGRAEALAARQAREKAEAGHTGEARDWRAIQAAIRSARGPLQA